ncbi:hypothetical protein [Paraburkholderia hayleyella]|uniref:hypothetical protein n=1 Tax=Paraburkholderia hayleyella TaxID=2152889 RepID=UPI00129293F2|nr:hypothetical protein [Paraburkholderia hayleyella]
MTQTVRIYKGFEIYPLVYPYRPTDASAGRNPGAGYNASVRISRTGTDPATDGRVFRLPGVKPFEQTGEARLACIAYAEQVIDNQKSGQTVADL